MKTKNLLRITRLTKQFTKFNILIYTRKLVVWHFCKTIQTDIASENFIEKTTIKGYQMAQKISYLFQKNTSWDVLVTKQRKPDYFEVYFKIDRNLLFMHEKQIMNGEVSFIRINLMGMNFLLLVFKCSKVFKQGRI
jgi:hypothetical protein